MHLKKITGRSHRFVHQAVLDDFEDLSGHRYACGAPVMVDVARKTFIQEKNLPENEFFADAFTGKRWG